LQVDYALAPQELISLIGMYEQLLGMSMWFRVAGSLLHRLANSRRTFFGLAVFSSFAALYLGGCPPQKLHPGGSEAMRERKLTKNDPEKES